MYVPLRSIYVQSFGWGFGTGGNDVVYKLQAIERLATRSEYLSSSEAKSDDSGNPKGTVI